MATDGRGARIAPGDVVALLTEGPPYTRATVEVVGEEKITVRCQKRIGTTTSQLPSSKVLVVRRATR